MVDGGAAFELAASINRAEIKRVIDGHRNVTNSVLKSIYALFQFIERLQSDPDSAARSNAPDGGSISSLIKYFIRI